MALNCIIFLLFLYYKIATSYAPPGFITHGVGYRTDLGEYYGAQAKISAWGVPDMNPHSGYEVSILLINKNDDRFTMIQAGFHVVPSVYGNNDLRFFIAWSNDADNAPPCYNMDCGSFVVANRSIFVPGAVVAPLSQYDGEDRYITIFIKKDSITELWTLYREHYDTILKLGWWEKGFMGNLDDKAINVQWVSSVVYQNNDTGPAMGSGHFPEEGQNRAAYMMDLKLFDNAGNAYDSPKISDLTKGSDRSECYNALPDKKNEHKFYYGGPGGCRN